LRRLRLLQYTAKSSMVMRDRTRPRTSRTRVSPHLCSRPYTCRSHSPAHRHMHSALESKNSYSGGTETYDVSNARSRRQGIEVVLHDRPRPVPCVAKVWCYLVVHLLHKVVLERVCVAVALRECSLQFHVHDDIKSRPLAQLETELSVLFNPGGNCCSSVKKLEGWWFVCGVKRHLLKEKREKETLERAKAFMRQSRRGSCPGA